MRQPGSRHTKNALLQRRDATRALRVAVDYRDPLRLRLNPANPRRHSARQISQIAQSISTFGFLTPLLVDDNGQVIAGHGRPGERNSYSVCTTWGIVGKKIYLIDVYRRRVEYPDLKRAVIAQSRQRNPRVILIEDASSGIALLQELKREGLYALKAVKADKDKEMRMRAQTALMENGQVYLPKEAPWLREFETELMLFPMVPNKDQADSMAQALAHWQERMQEPGMIAYYRMELEKQGIYLRPRD